MTEQTDDLAEAVEQLQNRVAALEGRLDELEGSADGGAVRGGLDRYDAYVINAIEERFDGAPSAREAARLYKEAGIRDMDKIRERHKFLKQSGRIETAVEA